MSRQLCVICVHRFLRFVCEQFRVFIVLCSRKVCGIRRCRSNKGSTVIFVRLCVEMVDSGKFLESQVVSELVREMNGYGFSI